MAVLSPLPQNNVLNREFERGQRYGELSILPSLSQEAFWRAAHGNAGRCRPDSSIILSLLYFACRTPQLNGTAPPPQGHLYIGSPVGLKGKILLALTLV